MEPQNWYLKPNLSILWGWRLFALLFPLLAPECRNREGFQEVIWLEEKDQGLILQLSEQTKHPFCALGVTCQGGVLMESPLR